jgi:hypothetical protein
LGSGRHGFNKAEFSVLYLEYHGGLAGIAIGIKSDIAGHRWEAACRGNRIAKRG